MMTKQESKPTFWQWFDGVVKKARTSPVGEKMFAAGFTVVRTGGGCLAWERHIDDNAYLWVCDEGNGLGDTLGEIYLLGIYVGKDIDVDTFHQDECIGIDLALRWCDQATTALQLCRKWVKRIGGGFHPDTRGKDYVVAFGDASQPMLTADEVKEYDADIERLFLAPGDPYQYGIMALNETRQ